MLSPNNFMKTSIALSAFLLVAPFTGFAAAKLATGKVPDRPEKLKFPPFPA